MVMGLGIPIPDLSNKPGPGRPGWGPAGSYDFQFEVAGAVTIKAQPAATGQSFTIKWPNGTEQTTTGSNSIPAPDGTAGIVSINKKTDNTYADEFAVVGGQTNVSKVVSWGQNPWSSMREAFNNCANLTSISETVFTAAAGCSMRSMLNNCDSLTIAKINNWNLSAGIDAYEGLIRNCDNLEELDATNLVVKFSSISGGRTMFGNNGNSVTNGCLFKMSGMDFSSTTVNLSGSNTTINMFSSCKFADGSDLSNWNFPATWNGSGFFNSSKIVGTNAVLNISNWDNYPGSSLSFGSMNALMGDTGAKINLTNLNLSNFNNMSQMFYFTDLSQIIGVSTWNATAGNVNAYRAFWGSNFLSVTPTDNFSNAFIQSLTPTNVVQMFSSFGNDNENVAVNLNGLDLSNVTSFSNFMHGAKFSTAPDFSNVTFPSTAISWSYAFYGFDLPDAATSVLDFSNVTAKISSLAYAFSGCGVNEIKFGDNVDFSQLTSFDNTFYNPPRLNNPQFPTNANFGAVTNFYRMFYSSNSKFSTCQADNFIRRLHATAFSNNGNVPLNNSQITEAPSIVQAQEAELVANGWTITANSTDATLPFAYPSYNFDSEVTQSVTPTTVPTGATFSSTDPGITVNASTGVVSWDSTYMGLPIIRCTYTDGCYNEVQMSMLVTVDNNYSMAFDAASSTYIDCGNSDDFTFINGAVDSGFSISAWIKMDDATRFRIANKYKNPGDKEYIFTISGSDLLGINIYDNNEGGYIGRKYNTALTSFQGQWIHVACTYDGTGSSSGIKLYLNGLKVDNIDNNSGTYIKMRNTSEPFLIGQQDGTYADGKMDELGVFNRELTAAQIKLIYDANSTNKAIKLSNLPGGAPVAWYRMGD